MLTIEFRMELKMTNLINRRKFFTGALGSAVVTAGPLLSQNAVAQTRIARKKGNGR
jgi:hypothetical protein